MDEKEITQEDWLKEVKGKLSEAVNQLAVQVVMVEPDDVLALGSMLERLEAIEKIDSGNRFPSIQELCRGLKKGVEKVILREFQDDQEGLHLLGEGIKLLQARAENPEASHSEESNFLEKVGMGTAKGTPRPDPAPPPAEAASSPPPPPPPPSQGASALAQDADLFKDFIAEALEHLGTIELNIINLEQSPKDKEIINAIFRPFHTIKGVSGFLNLKDVNHFSHSMESLLDDARNDRLSIHQEMIDFILEAVDFLKSMILDLKGNLEQGRLTLSSYDLTPYLEKITLLQKGPQAAPTAEPPVGVPPPPLGKILSDKGVVSDRDVKEALRVQAEGKTDLKIGEILVKESKAKPKEVIEALRDQKRLSSETSETTVKVDTFKLDALVDLVGELVITQSLIQQNPVFSSIHNEKLTQDFSQLKRITTDLQKISMSLRMVPIRQTFQKMVRLVRDLSKKSEKLVDLVMSGEETEIDRNMVESLYDPLVHMIRNAVDHGIELPAKRRERGKEEMGKVFLRAYQKGGNVIIEIEDDGQGLNRAKITQKAKERSLLSDEMSLNDHQVDNLIFEPGFSTADKITDVSGRGVGMDVVKRAVEKLKGKVEIFSTDGKGCRFVMRVPLTLAIMDGIIIQVGQEKYIIPTVFIRETLRPRLEDIFSVQQKGDVIKVRESLLPLVRLHHHLGVTPQKRDPWEALVIVVENEGLQKGLMVDDLLGKQEVVIKNLGERLKSIQGVAGATIMGDGRVGLILDMHGIFEIDQTASAPLS